jgi:muramoyltetrapeptide carboxypeptidase
MAQKKNTKTKQTSTEGGGASGAPSGEADKSSGDSQALSLKPGEDVLNSLKAPALKPGDKVGIVAPASRPEGPHVVAAAEQLVASIGFDPVIGENVLSINGYMAGTDEERLADLNGFINDRSIRGIFCISGGFGSIRLLDKVDYAALAKDPKVLVGSDENTCLLLAVNKATGLICFHGYNLDCIKTAADLAELKSAITSTSVLPPVVSVKSFPPGFVYAPVPGKATGVLLGGNLTALFSLMGTRYQPSFQNRILFLEDRNERNDVLERWLTSLFLSGELARVNAILFGVFEGCGIRGAYNLLSLEDIFTEHLKELKKPSCFGMSFGQAQNCRVIPLGIPAVVNTETGLLEFTEAATAK